MTNERPQSTDAAPAIEAHVDLRVDNDTERPSVPVRASGLRILPPLPDPKARFLEMARGLKIAVEHGVSQLTSYVLEERGDWFDAELSFLARYLKPGDGAVDLCAGHGVYALHLTDLVAPSGQVWAIEADPVVRKRLQVSAFANDFDHLCVLAELDAESSAQVLSGVQLVKVGPRGADVTALPETAELLKTTDPLWMVQRTDSETQQTFVTWAHDHGLGLYRYLPGLGVLYPIENLEEADPYLLHFFALSETRQKTLEEAGLLAQRIDDESLIPSDLAYEEGLVTKATAEHPDLREGLRGDAARKELSRRALAHFAGSRRESLSTSLRALCLRKAVALAVPAAYDDTDVAPLMTVARLAWAFGQRSLAVRALNRALASIESGSACIEEAFLAPHERYDDLDPRGHIDDWVVSATLEALVELSDFSTFFSEDRERDIARLALVETLGFGDAQTSRRLALLRRA